MKRLSIIIFSALLLIAFGGYAAAFDYGGSLTSSTSLSTGVDGIENEEALGLWLETGKGEHYSFDMKLDLIASFSDDEPSAVYLHPDYIKLNSFYENLDYGPSVLSTSFGRFSTADFTSKIFAQKIDGLMLDMTYPVLNLSITAGTTAFMFAETGSLLSKTTTPILSKTDSYKAASSAGLFEYLADPAGKTLLGSPRAVEIITLTFPQLFYRHDFNLSFVAQEDLRPMIDVFKGYSDSSYNSPLVQEGDTAYNIEGGGAVDTLYVGTGASGPIIPSLYHSVYYYFGTGRTLSYSESAFSSTGYEYQYDTVVSHMAGYSIDYFMQSFLNSKVGLEVCFGTGDSDANNFYEGNTDGNYTQFTPITSGGGGLIFSPGLSNIFRANINYSIKPLGQVNIPFLNNMQVVAALMPFFRLVDGPTAVSDISSNYDGNYLGSEIDLTMNMRPYSDLGIILKAGYFLPYTTAFEGSEMADPIFKAKLNVSLSF